MSWLSKLFGTTPHAPRGTHNTPRSPGLRLEALEDRLVPTVTYHNGALLQHVEAQGVYFGSDWYYNGNLYNQAGQLDGYLKFMVNSGYMDMLTNAGYWVGRGSATPGRIDFSGINKSQWLTDSAIRNELQRDINGGGVAAPDANRLYVIFVEPGVAIYNDHDYLPDKGRYANSIQDFLGYHGAFLGGDGHGHYADIHYAVIAYPGGYNPGVPYLNAFQDLTEVTSHELSESVTDPNVNYKALGWYDNQRGEIGDIVNGQWIVYHGYVVQKESNKYDQGMVPPDYHGYAALPASALSGPSASNHSALDALFTSLESPLR
jgi:hypothetical protein